ncbi:FtsB family cell division protein [Microcella sp.]|uniref:FtsB family cell division protein n=1 Tax=Microcella sp. TaxID=1913979 RepID=UPI00299F78ED|nr:septum formation initiator family protein [Microcella sp.]MDX2025429.1 septum formation initiator family protein [Microcella sp.]
MARQSRTVPVALPADAPASTPWFRNLQISGFTVTVLLLIVGALIVLAPSLRILVEQQQEIAELERSVAEQQAVVEGLQTDIDRWQDPAYIEAQARDLFFVYPGDITYLVVDDGMTIDDENAAVSTEIQTTSIDWTRALLSSIVTAGLTDLPADQLVSPEFEGVE